MGHLGKKITADIRYLRENKWDVKFLSSELKTR